MTINLLFFIITIKKVPRTLNTTFYEKQHRELHEYYKVKALEHRNHHIF